MARVRVRAKHRSILSDQGGSISPKAAPDANLNITDKPSTWICQALLAGSSASGCPHRRRAAQDYIAFECPFGEPELWYDILEGLPDPVIQKGVSSTPGIVLVST